MNKENITVDKLAAELHRQIIRYQIDIFIEKRAKSGHIQTAIESTIHYAINQHTADLQQQLERALMERDAAYKALEVQK